MTDSGEVKDLTHVRKCNENKLDIAHLNINSLRNKFELLTEKTKGNADILLIFETKIDENFPNSQLKINGFGNPHRVDRNKKGGGIMLLFGEGLPVKVLPLDKGSDSWYVEVILKKAKWLINYSYNPTKYTKKPHTWNLVVGTWTCTLRSLKISR